MCSGSEAGSYLRLTDFLCHSTLGLRVIKKKTNTFPLLLALPTETKVNAQSKSGPSVDFSNSGYLVGVDILDFLPLVVLLGE